MKTNLETFKNPSMEARAMPLWVWNDEMEKEEICRQLMELKEHGFGGAFVHPRPGLVTEYLSDEWFRAWEFALEYAKELGMRLCIYDENSYPSGFGGGLVSAELPDCLAMSAVFTVLSRAKLLAAEAQKQGVFGEDTANDLIKAFTCQEEEGTLQIKEDITSLCPRRWKDRGTTFCLITRETPQTRAWMGGFAYVDLLRPEVAQLFLKKVYEPYYERFKDDFGKAVPAVFSDEPYMTGSKIYSENREHTLPFSYWFAYEFQKEHHYDLLDHLPMLFVDAKGDIFQKTAEKVRYDFYCTMHRLWVLNFLSPLSAWCRERGIAWTGHFMEHEWPLPFGSPSVMENYMYMDYPGIDLLQSDVLLEQPAHILLLTFLELKSVANQLSKERTLCEIYGAGGWDSAFADYKRMGDWALVQGINLLNPHLVYSTIAGARKRDHPQSFSWHEPWWEEYTDLNLYQARIAELLSKGYMEQRILVLHPTYTGYLAARISANGHLMRGEIPENPNMRNYLEMLQFLTDCQWDFDLGAEGILKKYAEVKGSFLQVGKQRYEVVILPGDMKTMTISTMNILKKFVEQGGKVYCTGTPGNLIEGEAAESAYREFLEMPGVSVKQQLQQLDAALEKNIGRRASCGEGFPRGVAHIRKRLNDGTTVYFWVNHSMGKVERTVALPGNQVILCNAFEGSTEKLSCEIQDEKCLIPLELDRNQSMLLLVSDGKEQGDIVPDKEEKITSAVREKKIVKRLDCKPEKIYPGQDNVCVLDYCDLRIDGSVHKQIHVLTGNKLIFQKRGFDGDPWEEAVQYKRRILDRNIPEDNSGYEVIYHLEIVPGVNTENIKAAVEKGKQYQLRVNGVGIEWCDGQWMDCHYDLACIGRFLREGENGISLTAQQFDVRRELDSACILGAFTVRAGKEKWRLEPEEKLGLGPWTEQGYPFYPNEIHYVFTLEFPGEKPDGRIRLKLPHGSMRQTAARILVNGKKAGFIGLDDSNESNLTEFLQEGKNVIDLVLYGSLKNLFGPFHDRKKPRGEAWPKLWRYPPQHMPLPREYDLIEYGLFECPWIEMEDA